MKKVAVLGLIVWHLLLSPPRLPSQAAPQTLEGILAHARELEQKEDYAGAEKVYQQALSLFSNQPEVMKRLGILY